MAGELTIDEKLAMTLNALKDLRGQLFAAELQGIANTAAFKANITAKKQHQEKEQALKLAITQLNQKYAELEQERTTSESSRPSNQTHSKAARPRSSDLSQADPLQPRSQFPPSEVL